jgi:WD40 repeat protein
VLSASSEDDLFGFRRPIEILQVEDFDTKKKSEFAEGHRPMIVGRIIPFPNKKWLLSVGADNLAIIWDNTTGRELGRMEGTGTIAAAAISPNGDWTATGSPYVEPANSKSNQASVQSVKLWKTSEVLDHGSNANSKQEKVVPYARMDECERSVASIAFAPDKDARTILLGDGDGNCYVWKGKTGEWKESTFEKYRVHGKQKEFVWVRAIQFYDATSRNQRGIKRRDRRMGHSVRRVETDAAAKASGEEIANEGRCDFRRRQPCCHL